MENSYSPARPAAQARRPARRPDAPGGGSRPPAAARCPGPGTPLPVSAKTRAGADPLRYVASECQKTAPDADARAKTGGSGSNAR